MNYFVALSKLKYQKTLRRISMYDFLLTFRLAMSINVATFCDFETFNRGYYNSRSTTDNLAYWVCFGSLSS